MSGPERRPVLLRIRQGLGPLEVHVSLPAINTAGVLLKGRVRLHQQLQVSLLMSSRDKSINRYETAGLLVGKS